MMKQFAPCVALVIALGPGMGAVRALPAALRSKDSLGELFRCQ
jgi:hypothetical protein